MCYKKNDLYNNCLNALCNKHYISCDECMEKTGGCCSNECILLIKNNDVPRRPFLPSRQKSI